MYDIKSDNNTSFSNENNTKIISFKSHLFDNIYCLTHENGFNIVQFNKKKKAVEDLY